MVPQNGWFIMEHPIKMDDLMMIWGYHCFWKHPNVCLTEGLVSKMVKGQLWMFHDVVKRNDLSKVRFHQSS